MSVFARFPRRAATVCAAAAVLSVVLAGCSGAGVAARDDSTTSSPVAPPEASTSEPDIATAAPSSALALLGTLAVKGRAPRTGYDRDAFGQAWADTNRNGCDTRNDTLNRDLVGVVHKPGTRACVVATGTLIDPYSATSIAFIRGQSTSNAVQIDHVVSLSNSWQTGSQYWDANTRLAFANDSLNLLAVDGPLNLQKGNGEQRPGCRPTRATAARTSHVRSQSKQSTSSG